MADRRIRAFLEATYRTYHKRSYVVPDPLQHLYQYDDVHDREVAGLVAASLALGRVSCIVETVGIVLGTMGRPYRYVTQGERSTFLRDFDGFKYRFYSAEDIAELLCGMKAVLAEFGSLEHAYLRDGSGELENLTSALRADKPMKMIARPEKGSCCKRLNLFLRWMVRSDEIDPGGWCSVDPASLTIPLDVHLFSIGKALGIIKRTSPDMQAARALTGAFREIDPADPCRFDFSLSRQGIHPDLDRDTWLQRGFVEVA